ncbi:HEPN domain-containing protein [uncultured Gammaproteobacteria bacterium]
MTLPKPEQWLELAEELSSPTGQGAPKQVKLRRAVSSAYYGLFHATMKAAADNFIGTTKHLSPEYRLAYRAVNHDTLKRLCIEASKKTLPQKYHPYIQSKQFCREIRDFSSVIVNLQEERHSADYDPAYRIAVSGASAVIKSARYALGQFYAADQTERLIFLALLLFPPR